MRQAAEESFAQCSPFSFTPPRDLEGESRLDRVTSIQRRRHHDFILSYLKPRFYPVIPWIDQLPHDHPCRHEIISGYLGQVEATYRPNGWPSYRRATELYLRDLLLHGAAVDDLQKLLDQMAENEKKYIRSGNNSYGLSEEIRRAAER